MKKSFLIGSLLLNVLLVVLLFTVNRKKHGETTLSKKTHSAFMVTSRQDPIKEAQEDVRHFVDSVVGKFHVRYEYDFVRAFTISAKDMLEVMGLDTNTVCNYYACRAYLGLDHDNQFKMYLTPVDVENGRDLFLNHNRDRATTDVDSFSYVLDLIAPCPNTCDYNSPLYNFSKLGTER